MWYKAHGVVHTMKVAVVREVPPEETARSDGANAVVQVHVQLTWQDYARFTCWHLFHTVSAKVLLVLALLLVVRIVTADGAAHGHRAMLPLALLVVGIVVALAPLICCRAAATSYASHRALREPLRFTFSADGISAKSTLSFGRCSWSAYWRAFETRDAFYLYLSRNLAQIIPKRCFENEDEVSAFRNMAREAMSAWVCRFRHP
jgi:hypothetical protein